MTERIMFVDENDEPIGAGPREEAWANGTHVRIVRVIVRDEQGRILSQHRSATKKSYPNCWTDSASGHVDEGEDYDTSVRRELEEELGLTIDLRLLGKFETTDTIGDKTIREFNCVYEGTIDSSTPITLEEGEVTEVKWFTIDEVKALITQNPLNFTLGFRETMKRYYS